MKSYPGMDQVRRSLLAHKWPEAKRLMEQVIEVSESAGVLNDLALFCARTGEWERALGLMENAMQRPDQDVRTGINYFYISELSSLNPSRGQDARNRVLELKTGDEALKPKLSIVMRTFNRGELIAEAVKSVRAQSFKDWELVIVNDEGGREVEAALEKLWDKRMVYAYAKHSGPAGAFNVGLRLARGTMIGFLDDDDFADPECWARLVSHLEMHPEASAVYSDLNLAWLDQTGRKKREQLHEAGPWEREKLWRGFYIMNLLTLVLRREVLDKMPGFLEGLKSSVDWEFMLALSHVVNFDYVQKPSGELRYWQGLEQVGKRSVLDRNHQRNLICYYHGITPLYKMGLASNADDEKFLLMLERLLKRFPELMQGLELRKLFHEPAYALFYQLGLELMKEGRKKEARECFNCGRKLAPAEIKVWARLLRSYV